MRKMLILVMVFSLCGCAAKPVYETVTDGIWVQSAAVPGQVELELPEYAQMEVLADDSGCVYSYGSREVRVQVLPSGDTQATLATVSGYGADRLTVLASLDARKEAAWVTAGETGLQTARTAIWDDGSYHYCVSLLLPEAEGAALETEFASVARSVKICYTEP